jgi:hypothetical protein
MEASGIALRTRRHGMLNRFYVNPILPAPASFAGVEGKASGDVMDFGTAKSAFLKDSEGNLIALNEFLC